MKILVAFCFVVTSFTVNSQTKNIFSAAIYTGGFFPGNDFIYSPEEGLNIGIDLESRKDNFAFYLNSTYNRSEQRVGAIEFEYTAQNYKEMFVSITEIYTGTRWYMGPAEKLNGSGEFGLGYYHIIGTPEEKGSGQFGFNIGAGLNYPVSGNVTLSLRAKYHAVAKEYYSAYGGLYLGLRYSFIN